MKKLRLWLVFCLIFSTSGLFAQFKKKADEETALPEAARVETGDSVKLYWECGFIIKANGGDCGNITISQPIPISWPEQTVRTAHEEISPYVKVGKPKKVGGVTVLPMKIPALPNGEEAKVLFRYEAEVFTQEKPKKVKKLVAPTGKQLTKELKDALKPSLKIESNDKKIAQLAKEIGADADCPWKEIEAVYDWVREEVQYENGPTKGAIRALEDKKADNNDLAGLFIAICRAKKIPARMVWVPEHSYAEFYLVDADGNGRWYPCQTAGERAFGEMPIQYFILQKGDQFKSQMDKSKTFFYLPQEIKGQKYRGGGTPNREEIHRKVEAVEE